MVLVGDSQIPSYVPDCQPMIEVGQNADMPQFAQMGSLSESHGHSLVKSVASKVAAKLARAQKASMKPTMKWLPFMSTFVLDKMYEIV